MQRPGDFWAFSFEVTNCHYFNENKCQFYTTMTILWRNVSVNVVANSNSSCLSIFAPKVHGRVQQDACSSARIARVSQQCIRDNITVRKCLKRNNGHLITLQIWMEWRYRVWRETHKAILKPSSKARNSFWIKSRTDEYMGQFFAGPINKAAPSLTNSLTRVSERWRKAFSASSQKTFAVRTYGVALSWIVETVFNKISTANLLWVKAA